MKSTASSYFIPSSISASATITGARPRPATQCTATQESGFSRNLFFSNSNHSSTTCNLTDKSVQYMPFHNGHTHNMGYAAPQLVEALRYKPKGCRFYSWWDVLRFSINLILLAALWAWSWLSLLHQWVPGIVPWGYNLATFMCCWSEVPYSLNPLVPLGPI